MTQGELLAALILPTLPEQHDKALRRGIFLRHMPPITMLGGGQILARLE